MSNTLIENSIFSPSTSSFAWGGVANHKQEAVIKLRNGQLGYIDSFDLLIPSVLSPLDRSVLSSYCIEKPYGSLQISLAVEKRKRKNYFLRLGLFHKFIPKRLSIEVKKDPGKRKRKSFLSISGKIVDSSFNYKKSDDCVICIATLKIEKTKLEYVTKGRLFSK